MLWPGGKGGKGGIIPALCAAATAACCTPTPFAWSIDGELPLLYAAAVAGMSPPVPLPFRAPPRTTPAAMS